MKTRLEHGASMEAFDEAIRMILARRGEWLMNPVSTETRAEIDAIQDALVDLRWREHRAMHQSAT